MKIKNISYYMLLFAFMILAARCNNPAENSNDLPHYIVISINDISINEFIKDTTDFDGPLEIEIKKSEDIFVGNVLFRKLGWKKINRNCTDKDCFIIKTPELERADFISFFDIEITDSILTGMYAPCSPTIDVRPFNFKAKKMNNIFTHRG